MERDRQRRSPIINVTGSSAATTGTTAASLIALSRSMRASSAEQGGAGSAGAAGGTQQGNAVRNVQQMSRGAGVRVIQSTEEAQAVVSRAAELMQQANALTAVSGSVNTGLVMQALRG